MKEHQVPILTPTARSINAASQAIIKGGLVAFPTETVYGLGADATNDKAVAGIFEIKNRPKFNPLIIHVKNLELAREIVIFNDLANQLAKIFWPGALTLILPRRNERISLLASAGLKTLAVRAPNHNVAQALLNKSNLPLAAPSANQSGRISPTMAKHVASSLFDTKKNGTEVILDGGPCQIGIESTVIDLSENKPTLLRPGGISVEEIEAVIGPLTISEGIKKGNPKSPGMLDRHYAPNLPLRLNAKKPNLNEAFLAFGPCSLMESINLSPTGNLKEAAANLFAMINDLDRSPFTGIAIMPIPNYGLGLAINDRLKRASKPID